MRKNFVYSLELQMCTKINITELCTDVKWVNQHLDLIISRFDTRRTYLRIHDKIGT